jgi:capsular exopolysaccharide synthesis family protein
MRQTDQWPRIGEIDPASAVSEAYRALRTHIRFALGDADGQAICITSCAASEGRSLTAANLAIAMAREGRNTLLIDADMRKPVLHRIFRTDGFGGLVRALERPHAWKQEVVPTGFDRLSLLSAGGHQKEPADLLAGGAFRELLAEARETFDAIILDTPPLLPYADGRIAAARSDGVILVVGAGKVKRRQAKLALGHLHQVGANVLGMVVNG